MNKNLLTLLISLLFIPIGFGQSIKAFQAAAQEAFVKNDYYTALAFYEQVLHQKPDRLDIVKQYAISAERFGALEVAESRYSQVANSAFGAEDAEVHFRLAEVKRQMGKYEEARQVYQKYIDKFGNSLDVSKARQGIADSEWAIKVRRDSADSYKVFQLDDKVNSYYSDFSPVKIGDTLYYSSLQFEKPKDDFPVNRLLSKVMNSVQGGEGQKVSYNMNKEQKSVAHTAFTPDGSGMFYTLCDYKEGTAIINCEIYYKEKQIDGSWGKEMKLPDFINQPGKTATHPNVGLMADGRQILYFASNREGSLNGSLDIWSSTIESKGVCAQPVNLLEINTDEDDGTPFYHNRDHTLYFASKGRQGMGGYDIFRTKRGATAWQDVEHLGYPINSSYNDLYYYLENGTENRAYFSSNRIGSRYLDKLKKTCCNDIYRAIYADLRPATFNAINKQPLTGTTVHVVEITETGAREDTRYDTHEYYFPLGFEKRYKVYATKEGWAPSETIELTTEQLTDSKTFLEKLYLTPAVDLTALTYDADSNEPLNGVGIELVELSSNAGNPKMNENGHEYLYNLEYGKCYKVVANKPGWEIVRIDADDPGTEDTENMALEYCTKDLAEPANFKGKFYLRKLPPPLPQMVTVYFDNDKPGEDLEVPETEVNYVDSYEAYLKNRPMFESCFRDAKSLTAELRESEAQNIAAFFDYEVIGGYNKLLELTNNMKPLLAQGRTIKLRIQGFASPRYKEKYDGGYNKNLACRRVMSLRNYFASIPELQPYLDQTLILEEQCIGDQPGIQQTPPETGVMSNKLASIYSVNASRWRKVQIDLIELSELKN